jgi:hypothetical protein
MQLRLLLSISLSLPALAQSARIPDTHATSFSGATVDLPQSLRGHTTVLILGFSQGSRAAVTAWALRLAADYRDSPTVLYYEMPVLAGVPHLLRGVVLGKIKKDVPPRAQPHFVPILDHESDWKLLTGFNKQGREDAAYLLVVDGTGAIRSRLTSGLPTDQTYADLKHHLEVSKP